MTMLTVLCGVESGRVEILSWLVRVLLMPPLEINCPVASSGHSAHGKSYRCILGWREHKYIGSTIMGIVAPNPRASSRPEGRRHGHPGQGSSP